VSPATGFVTFLALTVVLLGLDVWTGLRARRRLHIPLVVLTLASLGVAIFYAERLGQLYDLDAAGAIYPIHLMLAKVATAAYLLPVVTGVGLLAGRGRRRAHRMVAFVTIALTLATAGTGVVMIMGAPELAPEPGFEHGADPATSSAPAAER